MEKDLPGPLSAAARMAARDLEGFFEAIKSYSIKQQLEEKLKKDDKQ